MSSLPNSVQQESAERIPPVSSPRIQSYGALSPKLIQQIADTYRNATGETFPDQNVFSRWVADSYSQLPLQVEFVDHDPYRTVLAMRVEVDATGILQITAKNNDSILDPKVNLMFRAVHDVDHIDHAPQFGIFGELKACRAISSRCEDDLALSFLFSEIVSQACVAVTYGDFEVQKFVRFPRRFREEVLRSA